MCYNRRIKNSFNPLKYMKKIFLRTLISTGLGGILGIICIIGVNQRLPANPLPSVSLFLLGAWYNRLIMGVMIGLAGELHFLGEKYHILESILRGLVIGAIISVSFSFLQNEPTWTYFFAGTAYGLIIDVTSTLLIKNLVKNKE
jgi:hypothetical protein